MKLGNVTDLVVDVTDKPMDLPIEILKFHVHKLVELWIKWNKHWFNR